MRIITADTPDQDAKSLDLLSARELAAKFSLHPKTVHRWANQGLFPSIRFNARVVRYRASDVESLIAANVFHRIRQGGTAP